VRTAIQGKHDNSYNYFNHHHATKFHTILSCICFIITIPSIVKNNEAKYIRKNIITDANKLFCRAIVQVNTLETSCNTTTLEKLQGMYERLQSTLIRSEHGADSGRGKFKQTELALDSTILQKRKRDKNEINLPALDEQQREHYTREALISNRLPSSMGIRRSIEVFRNQQTDNYYFANAEAGDILEEWNATQG